MQQQGDAIGRRRARSLIRQAQEAVTRRRTHRYRQAKGEALVAPNLLERRFDPGAINRVWAGDITYVGTGQGWSYLAILMDLHSRRIVGWAFAMQADTELVITYFLVRTCVDRLAGDGQHTISKVMQHVQVKGLHRVEFRDAKGRPMNATLELHYQQMTVLLPIGKQSRYPELQRAVLHAQERDPPAGRARIEWNLITNLPVRSRAEAIEKLDWYAMRWKIEAFHKILKSGCKAEESRLRTADRLTNPIAVFCILSWRIF
nr:DDE-type integrase/transposase/recombinase [Paraburkholderia guartelaensis]